MTRRGDKHRRLSKDYAGAAGFAVLGFLVNGFAPLIDAIAWLKYVSPFYSGHDPLANGVDLTDLAVLAAASVALMAFGMVAIQRLDLRG
jgi:putative exporter of polyketide antibiotics